MAQAPVIPIAPCKSLSGTAYPRQEFPEAASQTFLRGALVFVTGGYLQECGADPALIMGVATRDGQNGATAGAKKQVVYLAHPETLFKANLDTSGSPGTGVTAATDRGVDYGVAKSGTTNFWYVDKAETTDTRVRIWDFWGEDALGDVQGRVIFNFHYANFQGAVG